MLCRLQCPSFMEQVDPWHSVQVGFPLLGPLYCWESPAKNAPLEPGDPIAEDGSHTQDPIQTLSWNPTTIGFKLSVGIPRLPEVKELRVTTYRIRIDIQITTVVPRFRAPLFACYLKLR